MSGWQYQPLGNLIESLDAKRQPVKEADRRSGPYPYYGASGVVDHVDGYLFEGLHLLIAEDGENLRTRKLPIAFLADGRFWVNNHAHVVRGNARADTRFLSYALMIADVGSYLSGSTMPKLTQGNLHRIPIYVPNLDEQIAIAGTLGALDDKIELNRRMNETLEAMAQAIFRDWFVDFGPVRRKLACATDPIAIMGGLAPDPVRAAELAVLFPGQMDDRDLPAGWKTSSIYDHARVVYGAPFSSDRFNTSGVGRPLVRIRDLPNHCTGIFTDEVNPKEHVIQAGDIVVGMDGEFRARLWHGVPSLMNQRVCSFIPITPGRRSFVLQSIRPLLDTLEQTAVGTTVIHLGKRDIDRFSLIDPGTELLAAYGQMAEPLMSRAVAAGAEIRTLAETRDYLLPRLMSGEVKVQPEREDARA